MRRPGGVGLRFLHGIAPFPTTAQKRRIVFPQCIAVCKAGGRENRKAGKKEICPRIAVCKRAYSGRRRSPSRAASLFRVREYRGSQSRAFRYCRLPYLPTVPCILGQHAVISCGIAVCKVGRHENIKIETMFPYPAGRFTDGRGVRGFLKPKRSRKTAPFSFLCFSDSLLLSEM